MASANLSSTASATRRIYRIALWLVPFTGAGLYLFARTVMNPLVASAVVCHVVGGVVLGVALLVSLVRARRRSGLFGVAVALSLATGLALIVAAASGRSVGTVNWVFSAHVWIGFALLAGLLATRLKRSLSDGRGPSPAGIGAAMLASTAAVLAATGYNAEDYYRRLTATNAQQAQNPLFPGWPMRTGGKTWNRLPTPAECGSAGCHPDTFRDWQRSRHAVASTAMPVGGRSANWCAGCHATSALLSAADRRPGEGRGVDCVSCHGMSHVPIASGNGLARFAPPAAYPFAGRPDSAGRWLHGFFLRLRPAPHGANLTLLRGRQDPNLACAPCHRMAVNAAQNQYRFLRYDDTWAEWQAGPYSGESLHVFKPITDRKDCIGCHMPRDPAGRVAHACFARPVSSTQEGSVRVEIVGLLSRHTASGSERVDSPLENRPVFVARGEDVVVDVLVENQSIGHAFPSAARTGAAVWLALQVRDEAGRTLLASPSRPDQPDDTAHRYGQLPLDRTGRPLEPSEKDRMVATAFRRFIRAGEADVARYRLRVPASTAVRTLTMTARLLRRPRGRADGSPEVLSSHSVTLGVRGGSRSTAPTSTRIDVSRDASRLYMYGVGLLLQGDIGRARRTFIRAARLDPREPLYLVGAARAHLAERDLLSARQRLDEALQLRPGMPQALAWLGAVERQSVQLEKALAILTPLSERFPRDRQLWMEIGLCRLERRDNDLAAEAFQKALAIDPDDAAAHQNLMECYRREMKTSLARREDAIFRALQDDEPLRAVLGKYYRRHPGARLESLASHEHVLRPTGGQPE